jgi:hypothetical protein
MLLIKSSVFLCTLLTASATLGQQSREQTLENLRKGKPENSILDKSGRVFASNEDIGTLEVVKKSLPPPTVALATSQSFFYTDNALLTETEQINSIGWHGSFNVVFVPYSTYRWIPSVSFEQHLFRYQNSSPTDFDAQILSLASVLHLNEKRTWSWSATYALWRLCSTHGDEKEFYKQGELANWISWYRPLTSDQTVALRSGMAVKWRHVTPSFLDRISTSVGASLSYAPINSIEIAPFVEVGLRFYPTDTAVIHDRRDFVIEPGVSLTWWPHKNISVGGSLTFIESFSNNDRLDYEVLFPSAGVSASIHF